MLRSCRVTDYSVFLGRQVAGKNHASILCNAGSVKVFIRFVDPASQLPHNTWDESKQEAKIYLPAEQYSWYIDLLRNEEPVSAVVNTDEPNLHTLQVGGEPPGEAE